MTNNPPELDVEVPTEAMLVKPLLLDFVYVTRRLPLDQQRQWEALGDGRPFDHEQMALALAARIGPKWCLLDIDTTPLAIGGYDMIREGVWQDWLIGTEDAWRRRWVPITRHCRRIMNMMLEHEAHRLQTIALAERVMAHKWFRTLGLEYEGLLRGYGHSGEDCVIYSRVAKGGIDGRQ